MVSRDQRFISLNAYAPLNCHLAQVFPASTGRVVHLSWLKDILITEGLGVAEAADPPEADKGLAKDEQNSVLTFLEVHFISSFATHLLIRMKVGNTI